MLDKILVSQCFMGERVRYNGHVKILQHPLLTLWKNQNRLITICPEVSGGLKVPRDPAEINPQNGQVETQNGINVTKQFKHGAELALALCQKHQIRFALLKESSPSCGSTLIYNGAFNNNKISGQGITTQLLTVHGIQVFSEKTIEDLASVLDKQ